MMPWLCWRRLGISADPGCINERCCVCIFEAPEPIIGHVRPRQGEGCQGRGSALAISSARPCTRYVGGAGQ